jgi:radical SAM superfamily enzyme YgiQ (UPF0313 family)
LNYGDFFDNQRDRMVRKGDWTRAAELNLLPPEAWERPLRVLLTRLSTYEDTSLSLTHHYLYALVSSLGFYPDRAFLPPGRDDPLWKEFEVPWLVGLQSRRSGEEFDLIAFSNAVTQEMGNLLWFLKNSGFPLASRDRLTREDLPLVILGGANAPYSSLLWGSDSPVDAVFAGEDRDGMEALFRAVAEAKALGLPKASVIEALGRLPGVLLPGRADPVVLRPARAVLDPHLLAAMPVALGEGNPGKAVLAISAGCAGFCSFCAESWTRRPYAEAPAEALVEAALAVKAGQGAARLDLFSFNFNMHAELYPFLEAVVPWFSALGLKSQRFDSLAADPLLLDLEKLFGKTWFTCGLEGISDRLRRALNKNLDTDQVRKAFAAFARLGVRELKAFLIATGWEQESDYEEFARLLASIRNLPGPRGQPLKVVFSVTPLVHFPHTPLEFEPPSDPREVDRSVRRILRVAKEAGFEGRTAAPADEAAVCDLMLRPPSDEFYETWAQTVLEDGFVYRDEVPTWFHRHWKARWEAAGWNDDRLAKAYGVEANRSAPWARLDAGVRRSFLEAQHRRNLSFQELEPAGLVREKAADQNLVRRWTEAWKLRIADEVEVGFAVRLGPRAVAAGRDQVGAALARALMLGDRTVTQTYRGFSGSHWGGTAGYCALEGDDLITLQFLSSGVERLGQWTASDWEQASQRFDPFGTLVPGTRPAGSDLGPWRIEALSPWPIHGQRLLTDRGLKHTLRRGSPGRWVFDFPPQTLKKDWVRSLESVEGARGWVHTLVPGAKWDPRVFLEEGFAYPPEGGTSRVRLVAVSGSLPPR